MKTTCGSRGWHRGRHGFALVAVLSMMVLLMVLCTGLLGLSSISLRQSRHEEHRAEARANARLAMNLAIGELQKHLGADGRTSVPAASLAGVLPALHEDWQAATAVMSTPDETVADGKERLRGSFRTWLVSGDPQATAALESAASSLGGAPLELLRKPAAGMSSVRAGAVPLSGGIPGRFAWWVEDLGTKASLALPSQEDPALRLLAPDRFGAQAIAGLEESPAMDSAEWDRVASTGTAELLSASRDETRAAGRSVTALHRGVLADVAEGRLKRDLTSALGVGRAPMERLLGERVYAPVAANDPGGPAWEQLRQYYQSGGTRELTVRPQTATQTGCFPVVAGVTELYGLSNTTGFAPSAAPHPTLAAEWYTVRQNGQPSHVMTFHMTPVIKLWNPYDLPLRAPEGFTVAVANGNAQHATAGGDGSYQDVIYWGRNGGVSLNIDARPPKTARYEHRYRIPPVTFAPGEVRVFGLSGNRFLDLEGTYQTHSGKSVGAKTSVVKDGWILGELADITSSGFSGHSFWDLMFTKRDIPAANRSTLKWGGGRSIGGTGGTDGGDIQVLDSDNPGGLGFQVVPHPFTTWSIRLFEGKAPLPAQGTPDPRLPLVNIRNVNTDTTGFNKANTLFVSNPDPTTFTLFLDPSGQDSIWARRFVLKQVLNEGDDNLALYNPARSPTKDAKWLANYNPRSPTVGCWPFENKKPAADPKFTGSRTQLTVNGRTNGANGNGLGTPGNYLSGMVPELISRDALFLNSAIGFSDFAGPDRCVLFQTPSAGPPEKFFHSPGQLRHASLWIENGDYAAELAKGHATEDWFSDNLHPAWPVGNSYADPRLDPAENRGLHRTLTVRDERSTYSSTFHDLSYHMNRGLWDGYFFSAKRDDGKGASYNTRLSATGPALQDGEDGFRHNAARLMLDGAFNINSTDPDAWAAFLSSLRDTTVGGTTTPHAAYPRVVTAPGGEVGGDTAVDHPDQYAGFRGLDAGEIRELAERITDEIKARGPAATLAGFVNRSVTAGSAPEHRLMGALQAAIDATAINREHRDGGKYVIPASKVGRIYDTAAFAGDIAAGVPGYLTQGDILERLGHLMTPRSDTFVIRTRGECLDPDGKILATAMCEATVQRLPEYVGAGIDPATPAADLPADSPAARFGRVFRVVSFRWLSSEETRRS